MSAATQADGARSAVGRGRPARRSGRFAGPWLPLGVVLGFLVLVQLLSVTGVLPRADFPPPTEVAAALGQLLTTPALWTDVAQTLGGWAVSLVIAVVLGTALGVVLGRVRVVQALFTPVIEFLRPIPSIALIPLVILTIGGGKPGEIFLAAYAAVWQMLVAAIYAVGSVDPVAAETARAFSFSRRDTLRWLTLPSMLPGLVTGVRIASATALIIVITSEILIGVPGLGSGLNLARNAAAVDRMYAYIVVIGLVGYGLNAAIRAVERRVIGWHPSVRKEGR
ncbi:ABC-type nitrate/sulfonate/bicarbonate transport system permease component [Georgenia soli]|uniref:ABC-type nitrate/sulfonate/bicarbonate transport system permease component n=1 Tax=Georgenia soli TaxID=638953 RepID=A0A2A9EN38_9MICO|nr:ABC transporter permease [Georgenia soli]PFG39662.1 ABC-type nitrate/sulfonate/bicarbonate transport system permease component [Georgenia soli]